MNEFQGSGSKSGNQRTTLRDVLDTAREIGRRRERAAGSAFNLSCGLTMGIWLMYPLLFISELLTLLWLPLGLVLYSLVFLLSILLVTIFSNMVNDSSDSAEPTSGPELGLALVASIGLAVSFSQISRHLYFRLGGFDARADGYWYWLRYGLNDLINALTFDFLSIFGLRFTDVYPTSLWSQILSYLFHIAVIYLVINTIIFQVRLVKKHWRRPSLEVADSKYLPSALTRLLIFFLWIIPILLGCIFVLTDGFSSSRSASIIWFLGLAFLGFVFFIYGLWWWTYGGGIDTLLGMYILMIEERTPLTSEKTAEAKQFLKGAIIAIIAIALGIWLIANNLQTAFSL